MIRRPASVWTAAVVLALVAQVAAGQKPTVDVTGAWAVTITPSSGGTVTGLAILSQDGSKITGMIGPAETDSATRHTPNACRLSMKNQRKCAQRVHSVLLAAIARGRWTPAVRHRRQPMGVSA